MHKNSQLALALLERWFELSTRFPKPGDRNRAEIVIKFILIAGLWGLVFAAGYSYIGSEMSLTVLVLDVVVVSALLVWMLHARSLTAVGHFLCTTLYVAVVAFSAGHPSYPISAFLWLMLAPILAFMICNKRAAWVWSGIVILTYIGWFVLAIGGVRMVEPMLFAVDQVYIDFLSVLGFFFVLIPLVSFYHHHLQNSLELMNRANEQFAAARQEAELASAAKTDFLASMSHEMRTPLNAIIGFSDLLKDSGLNPEQAELNQTVSRASKSLLHLIEELLDVSAIESRKIKIHNEAFDVRSWISATIDTLKPAVMTKELSLEYEVADDVPQLLDSDPARLSQITLNLVNNAIRFTKQGGISVEISMGELDDGSEALEFTVSDTGVGISPENQRKIFEPFYQVTNGNGGSPGGAGLGLSISNRLVKLLGGTMIEVSSRPGDGSQFSFCLPVVRGRRTSSDPKLTGLQAEFNIPDFCPRLLIVDDVADNRTLLESILGSSLEATIDFAAGGTEAWDKARKSEYDLIILDLVLPDLSGFEVLESIKTLPRRPAVLAYSAAVSGMDREKVRLAGFDGFLAKPVSAEKLIAQVSQLLTREIREERQETDGETQKRTRASNPH